MKIETMEYYKFYPHFYATLFGSLVATSDLAHGKVLSDRDLFSSEKFYLKLSQMYKPWRKITNYILSDSDNIIISNAAGLFIPWMNALAGRISPESSRINDVQSFFKDLVYHLTKKKQDETYSSFQWDEILLGFRLRMGSNPLTLIEDLLSPAIELMKEYQDEFYSEFWVAQEYSYYNRKIDYFMGSELKNDLNYGIEILNNWIFNSLPDSPITICLNRFLSSINPEIEFSSGFGLPGTSAIHIPPIDLNRLDLVLHEIFHSLVYESKILQNSGEIKIIGSQISTYLKNEESPIPFWTWEDIYFHEIEEIVADFVAGEAYKVIYPKKKDFQSTYANSDEFLRPIYKRLVKFSSILRQEGLKAVITSSLKNWNYQK